VRNFNALILATDKESNHGGVRQGDFADVEPLASTAVLERLFDARKAIKLNAANQPEIRSTSIEVSLNPEHRGFTRWGEPPNTWPLVQPGTNSETLPAGHPRISAIALHREGQEL